jgi:hypothetical protein
MGQKPNPSGTVACQLSLAPNGDNDGQYLKFTRAGKFVLQIGKSGQQIDSNDVTRLGRPADAEVDLETNRDRNWHEREVLMRAHNVGSLRQGRPDASEPRTRV